MTLIIMSEMKNENTPPSCSMGGQICWKTFASTVHVERSCREPRLLLRLTPAEGERPEWKK